jgi:hypothetical protein
VTCFTFAAEASGVDTGLIAPMAQTAAAPAENAAPAADDAVMLTVF